MSRFRFSKGEAGRGNLRRKQADRSCGKIRGIDIHGDVAAPVNALVSAINRNAEKAAKATVLLAASFCGKIRGIDIHGDVAAPVNALVSAINRNAEKATKGPRCLRHHPAV